MAKGKSKAGAGGATAVAGGGGTIVPNVPTNPVTLTDSAAQQLRDQQDSMYDANTTAAVKMYISNTDFDNQGHSLSQTLNYLEENGVDINNTDVKTINKQFGLNLTSSDLASLQYTSNYMAVAVHPIGQDVTLQRGAHDAILRNVFGISDYSKMTEKQLQAKLVGQAFKNDSYMSTSYDLKKNPFLSSSSGSGVSGGREVVYNIKAGKNTNVLFGAKKQSEIIIGKGTNFKITGVRYSGQMATPRGGAYKPQVIIDIETF